MSRCIIVGGAPIESYDCYRQVLREDDFLIYCDGGLKHEAGLGRVPSLVVGDFDSYEKPDRNLEIIHLPREKDDTDTVYAIKEGLKRGYQEFVLMGVCGGRLDHTLGNVYALLYLRSHGARGRILDDYSEMELVGEETVLITDAFPYFSLVNIIGQAEGIYIEDAKYTLTDGTIESEYQYGISNEVVPGKVARVRVEVGELLLIKVRRDAD